MDLTRLGENTTSSSSMAAEGSGGFEIKTPPTTDASTREILASLMMTGVSLSGARRHLPHALHQLDRARHALHFRGS